MRALLLSAGLGIRLRPITNALPKCLVPIKGKPLLDYWLEMLNSAGVFPILINLHFFPEKVESYVQNSRFRKIIKTVLEENLLGTGGTLLKNRAFFEDEPLMLVHADNLSKFDVKMFIERHQKRPPLCEITMMTFHSPTPQSCGIVELDERDIVRAFHEKVLHPPGNLANGAVYIIEPSVFHFLENIGKEVIDFSTEVLPHYVGKTFTFHNGEYHRDIGTIESYEQALKDFHE
ncbi:MAG: nucleotidyltransferase family protein [Candidatus Ozemobacteraceae bacterium]